MGYKFGLSFVDIYNSAALAIPGSNTLFKSQGAQQDSLDTMISILEDPAGFTLLVLLPWVLVLILSQYIIRQGYQAFLDLGPGGTPYNFRGYLRLCFLGLFALRQPLQAPRTILSSGYLTPLTTRKGRRPKVTGLAPHRQVNQTAPDEIFEELGTIINRFQLDHPKEFICATSAFEKHNTALFSTLDSNIPSKATEICHSHSADGSLHMTLHPADIKTVIESGWGLRHPLARGDWWWMFKPVPEGFVMIYAPRNRDELEVITRIIKASAWNTNPKHFKREGQSPNVAIVAEKPGAMERKLLGLMTVGYTTSIDNHDHN